MRCGTSAKNKPRNYFGQQGLFCFIGAGEMNRTSDHFIANDEIMEWLGVDLSALFMSGSRSQPEVGSSAGMLGSYPLQDDGDIYQNARNVSARLRKCDDFSEIWTGHTHAVEAGVAG